MLNKVLNSADIQYSEDKTLSKRHLQSEAAANGLDTYSTSYIHTKELLFSRQFLGVTKAKALNLLE